LKQNLLASIAPGFVSNYISAAPTSRSSIRRSATLSTRSLRRESGAAIARNPSSTTPTSSISPSRAISADVIAQKRRQPTWRRSQAYRPAGARAGLQAGDVTFDANGEMVPCGNPGAQERRLPRSAASRPIAVRRERPSRQRARIRRAPIAAAQAAIKAGADPAAVADRLAARWHRTVIARRLQQPASAAPANALPRTEATNEPLRRPHSRGQRRGCGRATHYGGVGTSLTCALPRGIRNNNPLNIEAGAFTQGQPGFSGSDGRFARFAEPQQGVDAASKLLDTYQNEARPQHRQRHHRPVGALERK
jgi:hypothetical protein